MRRHRLIRLGWAGACGLALVGLPAFAQGPSAPPDAAPALDPRLHELWQKHWRRLALRVIPFENDFAILAWWDPRYPSSRWLSVDQWRKNATVTLRERFSGAMSRPVEIVPPIEEGRVAAMTLPEMEPGHYGHLHSVQLVEVLGPEQMVVEDPWLIDADAVSAARKSYEADARRRSNSRFATDAANHLFREREAAAKRQRDRSFRVQMRMVGWPTKNLEPGRRFSGDGGDLGLHVAVIGTEPAGRRRTRPIVVPVDWFARQSATEDQFRRMLADRGMDEAMLIELVTQIYQEHRDPPAADVRVLQELERRKQQRQQHQASPSIDRSGDQP